MADKITSIVAREDNGNIQITFSLPWALVQKAQEETVAEMAKNVEVAGFRKGMAPISKVREKISQSQLIEHSLSHMLPKALGDAIDEHKLKIAIYPKFELIKAKDNEVWEIKATTCELPEVELGDYKKEVGGALRAGSIITDPASAKAPAGKEEKESMVISALLKSAKVKIPQILIEEEADSRISGLLARLEKLGLALESYLASQGKKPEDLRAEYANQAHDAISLDLILNKVAEEQNIKIDQKEVEAAFAMSQATGTAKNESAEDTASRKKLIESILRRRGALDYLLNTE